MISIEFNENHLKRTHVFFADSPKSSHLMGCYEYFQCLSTKSFLGFIKKDEYTKIIDLTKSPDEILNLCNKTTQYQINRSINEGAKFLIETDSNAFADFYNEFASSRKLTLLKRSYLDSFKNNLFISKGMYEDECLVMHANIIDQNLKRVHMLGSASNFRTISCKKKRARIGRINRFLHFKDMIFAKDKNMRIYDFGGYAWNTENKILQDINKFKDGFGGVLKRESSYTPFPVWLWREFKRLMDLSL